MDQRVRRRRIIDIGVHLPAMRSFSEAGWFYSAGGQVW
jgi:hypothetical protein